jgi:hypothetical protein
MQLEASTHTMEYLKTVHDRGEDALNSDIGIP